MSRSYYGLALLALCLTAPLCAFAEEEDNVVVLTEGNFDEIVSKSKFALVRGRFHTHSWAQWRLRRSAILVARSWRPRFAAPSLVTVLTASALDPLFRLNSMLRGAATARCGVGSRHAYTLARSACLRSQPALPSDTYYVRRGLLTAPETPCHACCSLSSAEARSRVQGRVEHAQGVQRGERRRARQGGRHS